MPTLTTILVSLQWTVTERIGIIGKVRRGGQLSDIHFDDFFTVITSPRVVAVDVTFVNVVEGAVGAVAATELGQGRPGVVGSSALCPAVPSGWLGSAVRGPVRPTGWARARGTWGFFRKSYIIVNTVLHNSLLLYRVFA